MLARVADCLYWMNRYLERTEFSARLVSLQVHRLPMGTAAQVANGWRLLFVGLGIEPPGAEELEGLEDDDYLFADSYMLTDVLTFEPGNPAAILNCLAAARENARQVRSCIGPEIWSSLNRAYLDLRSTRLVDRWNQEPELLYRDIVEGVQRFHGISSTAMCHGEEWSFMQLGTYVERAQLVGSMLRTHCEQSAGSDVEHGDWPMLLRACNAFEAYGHQFGGAFDHRKVVDLLVAEPDLPYSLRYALRRLRACLAVVDPAPVGDFPPQPFVILNQLDDLLDSRPAASSTTQPKEPHELAKLGELLREFHDAVEQSYVYYPADA